MNKMLLVVPLFITACSVIPTAYSPTLYNHAVELSVMTTNAVKTCDTPQAQLVAETLRIKADVLVKFTQYVSKDVNEVATVIDAEYTEFAAAYHTTPPSTAYCQMKVRLLGKSTESMLEMLGSKP
jgi:hypothetical protein